MEGRARNQTSCGLNETILEERISLTMLQPFWDSDIYKTVEAACNFLISYDDPEMRENVEEAVDMIRVAQHPDGYINSYYTVHGISQRWTNLRDMHEMYCLGHLMEACVAYETLTKSGRLLEPVMKVVEHIDSMFGPEPGKKRGYPGHEEIEIGLLRLYELEHHHLTLKLAQYFITERGAKDEKGETYYDHEARDRGGDPDDYMSFNMRPVYRHPRDYAYHQADERLVDTVELRGHAVRAMYYLTAATDLVRLTNDQSITPVLQRLWRDLIDTKLYVTGGLGAIRQWEGFGPAYFLEDTEEGGTCYAETCATFGLLFWCQRMLQLELRAEYADILEIGLYNGFLGAMDAAGEAFYYQNPLRTKTGQPKERSRWFEIACCPPNVAKLLGALGGLIYSTKGTNVAVHLYIGSTFKVAETDSVLTTESDLPWSGNVRVSWMGTLQLALRIPDWAGTYSSSVQGTVTDGYLHLPEMKDGAVELSFNVEPRKIYANTKTSKNEVCIMRGPLVYCIEDADNEVDIDNVVLSSHALTDGEPINVAGVENVVPVIARAREASNPGSQRLYDDKPWTYTDEKDVTFIPYFLRANRAGDGGMRVWCPWL